MKSEHVPIFVIDYILEQLIREKQGRLDDFVKRRNHIYYLLQSYNIFFYKKMLFDKKFVLKRLKGVRLLDSLDINECEKKGNLKMSLPYDELFNRIKMVYDKFWNYDSEALRGLVFSKLPSYARKYILKINPNAFVSIDENDIRNDHLNISKNFGWEYELSKSEEEVEEWRQPTAETYEREIKKMLTIIKRNS